jgi:hypothetical protein
MAQSTSNEPLKQRFMKLADGWKTVAETQAWLDEEKKCNYLAEPAGDDVRDSERLFSGYRSGVRGHRT